MRVFLAGGSGVIGRRVIPLLVAAGHDVTATTRSDDNAGQLRMLGAAAVVLDVFDAAGLERAVVAAGPELVMHQLTALPDNPADIAQHTSANARIRREGTRNLIAAARAAGASRLLAQSVAFALPGEGGAAVRDLEEQVLGFGGVVLRYGQLYGPGTYHPGTPPPPPRVHVDEAARRTVAALDEPSGIVTVTD